MLKQKIETLEDSLRDFYEEAFDDGTMGNKPMEFDRTQDFMYNYRFVNRRDCERLENSLYILYDDAFRDGKDDEKWRTCDNILDSVVDFESVLDEYEGDEY